MKKEKRKRRTPKILKRAEDFFQSLENNCDFNLHRILDDIKKMSNILIGCKCKFCLNAGNYLQFTCKKYIFPLHHEFDNFNIFVLECKFIAVYRMFYIFRMICFF